MPVNTGREAGAGTAGICDSNAWRANPLSRAVSVGTLINDDATMVATRARSGVTSPVPSGCRRLERKTMKDEAFLPI